MTRLVQNGAILGTFASRREAIRASMAIEIDGQRVHDMEHTIEQEIDGVWTKMKGAEKGQIPAEIAYQVRGDAWKRKTFASTGAAVKFIEKLEAQHGNCIDVRWAQDNG